MTDDPKKSVSVRLYLPSEDFRRRFKATCDRQGRSMSEVASELFKAWLVENEFAPPPQHLPQPHDD